VKVEIRPEPSPGEREAIHEALARLLLRSDRAAPSAWWREGVLHEGEHFLLYPGKTAYDDDVASASS
jgi:hypothetical protein